MFVCFGQSSGPIPPFNLSLLAQKGLALRDAADALRLHRQARGPGGVGRARCSSVVVDGKVKIRINQRYALKDAAKAHADLESRRTTGTTILIP